MKPKLFIVVSAIGSAALLLTFASCELVRPPRTISFRGDVAPILESRCLECHNRQYEFAGLNLETRELAMKGGRSGPAIRAGDAHQSLFYKVLLLGHEHPTAMPPTPEGISKEEQRIIHQWIMQGGEWPEGEAGRLVPPQFWPSKRLVSGNNETRN